MEPYETSDRRLAVEAIDKHLGIGILAAAHQVSELNDEEKAAVIAAADAAAINEILSRAEIRRREAAAIEAQQAVSGGGTAPAETAAEGAPNEPETPAQQ